MTQAELNLMFQERIDKLEAQVTTLNMALELESDVRRQTDDLLERMIRTLESLTNTEIGYKAISS